LDIFNRKKDNGQQNRSYTMTNDVHEAERITCYLCIVFGLDS